MINFLLSLIEAPFVWLSERGTAKRPVDRSETKGIGRDVDSGDSFAIEPVDLALHTYLIGSTGCGKTSLILQLLRADIERNHSLVVVDLRGDLVFGVLGLCQALDVPPERITLLDLRSKGAVQGFNPLGGAGEPFIRALHVLDVIASEAASWGVQIEESARSALLLLAAAKEPITRLEDVFYDDYFRHQCLSEVDDPTVVGFWERFGEMSEEKRQSWASPVLNKVTSLMAVPILRKVLGSSNPIDLGEVLSEPGRIFLISLAVDELQRSGRMLGSLIVSAITREVMARVNVPEKQRNPVRLYIDEFENMASESFENLIAEGRRFKLTLVLSHQTLAQLPARLRSVVRNNVGLQVVFQCGFEDCQGLARELPDGVNAADLRALGVGEAYAMYRDGETIHVQFNAPMRKPSLHQTEAYRKEVLKGSGEAPADSATIRKFRKVQTETGREIDCEQPEVVQPAESSQLDLEDLL